MTHLADDDAFAAFLAPLRKTRWFVYSKRPFAGPQAVLAYLSRDTHRVAISNSRLIAADGTGVTFKWKDYRVAGRARSKTMTLAVDEFIRRFLIHVPRVASIASGITAFFANGGRNDNLARARELLGCLPLREAAAAEPADADATPARHAPAAVGA